MHWIGRHIYVNIDTGETVKLKDILAKEIVIDIIKTTTEKFVTLSKKRGIKTFTHHIRIPQYKQTTLL